MKKTFSRRSFLRSAGAAGALLPFALHGMPLYGFSSRRSPLNNPDNKNILVLIQLQGGNDGLATIFDRNQYDNLRAVRENIIVPENAIIAFRGDYGFHPVMGGIKEIWDREAMSVMQNVGYPNQNRSHFRSTDIWNSASSAEEFVSTGWVGRMYDVDYVDYPNGFPNAENPHPFALTMGKIISETCQGVNANYSLSLLDPFDPGTAFASAGSSTPSDCYGSKLDFVNSTASQTNAFAEVIKKAAESGNNLSPKWDSLETELARKLRNVSRLISGGLQTRVYIIQLGGFDTHDNQVVAGETTTGRQAELLQELSDAACAFQDDLVRLGIDDRVLSMTYSEFGRRIRSNSSLGTDHGTAAPMFFFGSCVQHQILGAHPDVDPQIGIEEGVPMQYDFRDVYGTILRDWLGAPEAEIRNILFSEFQPLPIIKPGCGTSTSASDTFADSPEISLHPNPATDRLVVHLSNSIRDGLLLNSQPPGAINIYDSTGGVMEHINTAGIAVQNGTISLSTSSLPRGAYFVRIQTRYGNAVRRFVKL